jgi:trans-aconitate methyltransferase
MSSITRSYFDEMYEGARDPWGFATREYEQRKYALTMASLPKHRYRSAFEPGCSIGVLTEMLAARCDDLMATDIVPVALREASERLQRFPHVVVASRAIPEEWPEATFDLIVLSEIAYYFDEIDLARILSRALRSTARGAHLIAVHWRGETNYPLSGDRAHEIIDSTPRWIRLVQHIETDFVLGVWERDG